MSHDSPPEHGPVERSDNDFSWEIVICREVVKGGPRVCASFLTVSWDLHAQRDTLDSVLVSL